MHELDAATIAALDDSNPRAARARQLVANGGWLKCIARKGTIYAGRRFYGIPSQSRKNLYHLANLHICSCEDFTFRTDRFTVPCKHLIATRLYVAIIHYQQSQQASTHQEDDHDRATRTHPRRS